VGTYEDGNKSFNWKLINIKCIGKNVGNLCKVQVDWNSENIKVEATYSDWNMEMEYKLSSTDSQK
jgi:hypothetical protein